MKKRKLLKNLLLAVAIMVLVICIFFAYGAFSSAQNNEASLIDINSETRKASEDEKNVKLVAVGDIMLSRGVNGQMLKYGDGYPFEKMSEYLNDGDIVFGNLESPIALGGAIPLEGMVFRARPGVEKSIRDAGFTILSLANNHMGNQGQDGVKFTISALRALGINTVGAGENEKEAAKPIVVKKNGLRFAFLAYTDGSIIPVSYEARSDNYGVVYMDKDRLASDIAKAKKEADFVIVSMHGGIEYTYSPNQSQIDFAHTAIDNGADLVIGHHPHQVQDVEKYKNRYIFYSLGNFVFDQEWSKETKQGLFAEIYFNSGGVFDYNLTPVLIKNYAQPDIMDGDEATQLFRKIKRP